MRALARIIRKLTQRGPRYTARWAWYQICEPYYEWSLGIETASWDRSNTWITSEYLSYEPLYYTCIHDAFRALSIDAAKDVFLDYGSGKGRVLVVAGMYPFRRIIGVELAAELNAIAQENIWRSQRHLRCKDIVTVTADATTYVVPPDVTIVFLFNPFVGEALNEVQRQLRASLENVPRKLTIIYMNLKRERDAFADCDWLLQKGIVPTRLRHEMRLVIYESRW